LSDPSFTRPLKRTATAWAARLFRRAPLTHEQLVALRPRAILVVRQQNQMGDMVCATPVFRALRETFPSASIGLVTAPVNRGVVEHNPHLDALFTFDQKMWRNPSRLLGFLGEIRGFEPELAFVLSSVSFSVTSAAIALASGAPLVVGADSEPFGIDLSRHAFSLVMPSYPEMDRHSVQHSLAPLQAVGITTDDLNTVVCPSPEQLEHARDILAQLGLEKGFWALHPGAGKGQNIWPADRFARMAERAVALGNKVLILHGPADARALAGVQAALDPAARDGVFTAPPCPVGTGAALLKLADRFLCNDTGVMHMAGAVGVPTIALFGPTDPALWKPPSAEVQFVKSSHQTPDTRGREYGWMENISEDEVWKAWATLSGQRTQVV
jgi:heptosyltransferase-2